MTTETDIQNLIKKIRDHQTICTTCGPAETSHDYCALGQQLANTLFSLDQG